MKCELLHSMQVVKREEKETKLMQFVLGEVAAGRAKLEGTWSIIALSMDSPVVAAVRRVLSDLSAGERLSLAIVLTGRMKHVPGDGFEGVGALCMRTASNPRLLDAHEQLVVGERSSWTGDCMRRDPRQRDAFERFENDNSEAADWAQRSFERLWQMAVPMPNSTQRVGTVQDRREIDGIVANDPVKEAVVIAATSRN